MPNGIKYSTGTTPAGCLRKGNMLISNNTADTGLTFFTGIDPPSGGYTIYLNKASGGPSIYCPTNNTELVFVTNQIAGASYTTAAQCLDYFASQTDKLCVNFNYEGIVTDELVLNLDAGFTPSYPTTGTTWYDISGNNNTFNLFNGPLFNPNGYLSLDGVDDSLSSTNPQSVSNISGSDPFTFSALFKLTQYANQRASDSANYSSLLMKGAYNPSFGITLAYELPSGGVFTKARTYSGVRNLSLPSTASGYGNPTQFSNTIFALNRWYQVDFTSEFSGTTYTLKTYINGNLDITSTSTLSTYPVAFQNNSDLTVASGPLGGNGVVAPINISKAAIYKKTLSQAEINQNYYQGPIVTDGLVLALDAGNLVSYESGSTIAYSLTGSISGSLVNGTGYNSGNGGSWVFDGIDDTISVPDNTVLDFTGSVNLTSEVWINFNLYKDISIVNAKGNGGGQIKAYNYLFVGSNTSIAFRFSDGINDQSSPTISKFILPEGTWGHVVGVLDTTAIRIYLNGVEIGTATTRTINPNPNNDPLLISGPTYSLNGKIAISRIYNRALSAAEVSQNFNAQRNRFNI